MVAVAGRPSRTSDYQRPVVESTRTRQSGMPWCYPSVGLSYRENTLGTDVTASDVNLRLLIRSKSLRPKPDRSDVISVTRRPVAEQTSTSAVSIAHPFVTS